MNKLTDKRGAMSKTLFEKLLYPRADISLEQSVVNNIQHILSSGGYLDGDKSRSERTPEKGLRTLPLIMDQASASGAELEATRATIKRLILRHEPRVSGVDVSIEIAHGIEGKCRLKLMIQDQEVEHMFTFQKPDTQTLSA